MKTPSGEIFDQLMTEELDSLPEPWRGCPPISRVGQLPAGPMADRRTHRLRDRGSQRRAAIADQR